MCVSKVTGKKKCRLKYVHIVDEKKRSANDLVGSIDFKNNTVHHMGTPST